MSTEAHLLNVRELIELLTALPPEQQEMPVWLEGNGPAITVGAYKSQVIIERAQQRWDDETDSLVWRAIP